MGPRLSTRTSPETAAPADAAPDRRPVRPARLPSGAPRPGAGSASGILLALVALLFVGWPLSDSLPEVNNLLNVARQAAIVGILGIGMTFVILTAGIDLSVGSIVGFVAIAFASAMAEGVPGRSAPDGPARRGAASARSTASASRRAVCSRSS